MPICIVRRRSGFGRSFTIRGICRNTSNPRGPWHDESSALAALVLASMHGVFRW